MRINLEAFLGMICSLEELLDMSREDPSYLQKEILYGDVKVTMEEELKALYCQISDSYESLPEIVKTSKLKLRLIKYEDSIETLTEVVRQLDSSKGHIWVN
ncbi:MAG: hypothetical protein KKC19_00125 [Nanoarchaeota archaeon]|nr:hypothetical protein [Nanoarchaeota archaeon]